MAERTSVIIISMAIWTQMKDKQKVNHQSGRWSCTFWGTGEISTPKHLKQVDVRQLLQHRLGQNWRPGTPGGIHSPKSADTFFEKEGLGVAVSVCAQRNQRQIHALSTSG
jgi:hypothetical protein